VRYMVLVIVSAFWFKVGF